MVEMVSVGEKGVKSGFGRELSPASGEATLQAVG
jgi:hypothetical protein